MAGLGRTSCHEASSRSLQQQILGLQRRVQEIEEQAGLRSGLQTEETKLGKHVPPKHPGLGLAFMLAYRWVLIKHRDVTGQSLGYLVMLFE